MYRVSRKYSFHVSYPPRSVHNQSIRRVSFRCATCVTERSTTNDVWLADFCKHTYFLCCLSTASDNYTTFLYFGLVKHFFLLCLSSLYCRLQNFMFLQQMHRFLLFTKRIQILSDYCWKWMRIFSQILWTGNLYVWIHEKLTQ